MQVTREIMAEKSPKAGRQRRALAKQLGVPMKLLSKTEVAEKMKQLLDAAGFDPAQQERVAGAILHEMAVRNAGVDDEIALKAAKALRDKIPPPVQVGVQVNVERNKEFLQDDDVNPKFVLEHGEAQSDKVE